MTLLRDLRRHGARVLAPLVAAAALLSACGGGTSQVQAFVPARLLVLGDEASMVIDDGSADGFKYSVNDRSGTTAGKCLLQPTVAQQVARHYGMVFAACNPTAATPRAFIQARLGAKVDDATTGLQAQLTAAGSVGNTDMVLVMIGANDIIDLYGQKLAGTLTAAQATAEAIRRGRVAATQINRILGSGARALVVTIPDMGKSPYALQAATTDPGADTLMSTWSTEYNAALRLGIDATDFDGRNYGLVLADDVIAAMERFPTSYLTSPANVKTGVCTLASLPQGCLVVTGATAPAVNLAPNTHLWASDRHFGPVAHTFIGTQAVSRAVNNPF